VDKQDKTILVIGATGRQGGAVARNLRRQGWKVRAVSRDPNKPAAVDLTAQGIQVVQGDLDDPASIDTALAGVYGAFSVQNPFTAGIEGAELQGKSLADSAKRAGVEHFTYSSVGGADRNAGLPSWDSKWRIEQHIRDIGIPATILRPTSFMENFNNATAPVQLGEDELLLTDSLDPGTRKQYIAVDDIGGFAALAFDDPERFIGQALEIAGDELTLPQAAQQMGQAVSKPGRYVQMPPEKLRSTSPAAARTNDWYTRAGYRADIPALRRLYPSLLNFRQWLEKSGWADKARRLFMAQATAGARAGT
jgi:uncharacterized protein YbjT (DUF2867 family)